MKTAKDLIIPFPWSDRRPILLDRFYYVPKSYSYEKESIVFFEKEQPVMIEYCSGNGQWIGEQALKYPHFNWLAVEKKFQRARSIWLKIHREKIPNLTVICSEAAIFTKYYSPKAQEIFINFPDPWPKLRHAKHRLIQTSFLQDLLEIVEVGSKITCVTDDEVYKRQMLKEFGALLNWKLLFNTTKWPDYGRSFFSDLWSQKGRVIHYLSYERI